ncbi:SCP2 sterol-binding domain-containing protein [Streptomyces sp. NPDC002795]|uniref:SCP2 sterol-binding domain-containing protein n=1 Tax=Streptomyces sp. NPDC002795 TaxID=3364665 RepID=UPI0036C61203
MSGAEEIAALDFASVTPEEFARLVKGLPAKEINRIARDETLRTRVLKEVFGRVERQFRPDAAGSLEALIRWKVTGQGEIPEAVYETKIANGTCTVTEGRSDAEPRLTLVMGDADFLKLVSGNSSPVTLFMTRKVKIAGDVALAARLTRYFAIPKA